MCDSLDNLLDLYNYYGSGRDIQNTLKLEVDINFMVELPASILNLTNEDRRSAINKAIETFLKNEMSDESFMPPEWLVRNTRLRGFVTSRGIDDGTVQG